MHNEAVGHFPPEKEAPKKIPSRLVIVVSVSFGLCALVLTVLSLYSIVRLTVGNPEWPFIAIAGLCLIVIALAKIVNNVLVFTKLCEKIEGKRS